MLGDTRSTLEVCEKQLQLKKKYLRFLETFLVNSACDDPSFRLVMGAVLPLLRDKLCAWAEKERQAASSAAKKQVWLTSCAVCVDDFMVRV